MRKRSITSIHVAKADFPLDTDAHRHYNIFCEECEDEIYGYRFNCLECREYNLCMYCTGMHPDHILVRITNPDDSVFCDNLNRITRRMRRRQIDDAWKAKNPWSTVGDSSTTTDGTSDNSESTEPMQASTATATEQPVEEPDMQESDLQEPDLQEPDLQDLDLREPDLQDLGLQELSLQESEEASFTHVYFKRIKILQERYMYLERLRKRLKPQMIKLAKRVERNEKNEKEMKKRKRN